MTDGQIGALLYALENDRESSSKEKRMEKVYFLPDKIYTVLKWLCLICLPAVGWAYGALAPDWGWPMADQIVHTLDVVGTLIGILIGISQVTAKEV